MDYDIDMFDNIKKDILLAIEEIEENILTDMEPTYDEYNAEFLNNILNHLNEMRTWW